MRKSPQYVLVVRDDKELHAAVSERAAKLGISIHRLSQHLMRVALGLQDGLPAAIVRRAA